MLCRARLVEQHVAIERFDWGGTNMPDTVDAPGDHGRLPNHAAGAGATAAAAVAETPGPPELTHAEQQAHLAALERDAFAKGYAQGERAGVEAGAKRAEAMLRRVAQTLEDLGLLRRAIIKDTERQMVQLSLALARRIVGREISLDPTLVAAMAHVALERLGESTPATIKLHPDDYATITAQRGERWEGGQVAIVPDASIVRGGCVVESAFGTVDGSLEAQFDEMTRALLGDTPAPPAQALLEHAS